jgi:nucleoside-triphosphatase THEP1
MPKQLAIVSGPRGGGKTTLCRRLLELAHQRGLDCAGIISPARFEGGRRVGIDLLDVRSGECRPLAKADSLPGELRTAAFRFDTGAVEWGTELLNAACPCDVLIVDELGPLELERGQGWTNALDVLRNGQFKLAVVVVRPALVSVFRQSMSGVPSLSEAELLFALPGMNVDDKSIRMRFRLSSLTHSITPR